MNTYTVFYQSQRKTVEALSNEQARQIGIDHWKVPHNKEYLVVAVSSDHIKR